MVRLDSALQEAFRKVIDFHHPGFAVSRETSYPNIETLLSEMLVNPSAETAWLVKLVRWHLRQKA